MRRTSPRLPPESPEYTERLETLIHAQRRSGRWPRVLLWLLGSVLSIPVVLGFLTLLPHTPPVLAPVVTPSSEPNVAATPMVAFYWNFTEWRRWMFTAYIHVEPCPPPPRQAPACQIWPTIY
jgi:hypothetical protein